MSFVNFHEKLNGKTHWHIQDDNNRVVLQGEEYDTPTGAREGFVNAASAASDALANYARDGGRWEKEEPPGT